MKTFVPLEAYPDKIMHSLQTSLVAFVNTNKIVCCISALVSCFHPHNSPCTSSIMTLNKLNHTTLRNYFVQALMKKSFSSLKKANGLGRAEEQSSAEARASLLPSIDSSANGRHPAASEVVKKRKIFPVGVKELYSSDNDVVE